MQSLSARRRVESRWNGDEGFQVPLELGDHPSEHRSPGTPMGCRRGAVRGGHGWVRAEFEHDDRAEEEAGDDIEQERYKQNNYASCDDAPCDVEEDKLQNEGAAEASGGGSDGGEPQAACGVCGERAVAADGAAAGDDTQRGRV
jgi:hypothetical protein